jgi:hypothetical protein
MDHADRQAIDRLFQKLDDAERAAPPRDPEAERYIADQIARRPGAAYYLAQTVIVQEQALQQVEQQQSYAAQAQEPRRGGLLSRLFDDGRGRAPAQAAQPPRPYAPAAQPQARGPWGAAPGVGQGGMGQGGMTQQPGRGGGFLAGAAQTAMGVAGGVVLGNMLMNAFDGGGEAQAAEPEPDTAAEDSGPEDFGGDDFGGDEF